VLRGGVAPHERFKGTMQRIEQPAGSCAAARRRTSDLKERCNALSGPQAATRLQLMATQRL